jgi:Insertion element 4 transposase N-terminal/Transposase DDE domain
VLMIREAAAAGVPPPEFSVEALAAVVTPAAVEAAVAACGVRERRVRKLPAGATVFLCVAMNLYAATPLGQVAARLVSGLRWRWPHPDAWRVSPGALCRARARVGARPLAALFKAVCRPLATRATPGAFLGRWRLMALDGTKWDVPDTPANARAFGRPASGRGAGAWPQVRVVALTECGTHAVCDAGVWRHDASEHLGARRLLRSVAPGMLLTWDRGLHSFDLVAATRARRAHLLGRLPAGAHPEVVHPLGDGTHVVRLRPGDAPRRRAGAQVLVRLITYTLDDPARPGHGEVHRLITSLLNPRRAPAGALVEDYHARWGAGLAFDELETHQRPPRPLRSRRPVGVVQEVYGLLLAHYVVRAVMAAAAATAAPAPLPPTRLSFLTALRRIRTTVPELQRTPPAGRPRLYRQLLTDLVRCPLPPRRNRSSPRVVKQKMSNFRLKAPGHRRWPQPTKAFCDAIVLAK